MSSILETKNVAEFGEENYLVYAVNCNLQRYFPETDGLKLVERRILTTLWMDLSNPKKYIKMGALDGSVTAKFHPHGSVGTTIGTMTAQFKNQIPFITGSGNFGSISGSGAAAARYPEVRLSDFARDCFFRPDDVEIINYKESYTGDYKEPILLPSAYPVMFINPSFSMIGRGFAANIPSYNFTETCKATIDLIRNPKAKLTLIPDMPTGCAIVDNGTLESIIERGEGKLTMEATYDIDYNKNKITITSVPHNTTLNMISSALTELYNAKKLDEVKDFENHTRSDPKKESGNIEVKFEIYLTNGTNPQKFMDKLMSYKTGLRETKPIMITVSKDYTLGTYSLRDVLLMWIENRRNTILTYHKKKLTDTYMDIQVNSILIDILNDDKIERTIALARSSVSRSVFASKLMKEFGINSVEADTIARMPILGLTKESRIKYKERLDEATKEQQLHRDLLMNSKMVDDIIIGQLKEGIKKYGKPRKSPLISHGEKAIINNNYVVRFSRDGYFKKILTDEYDMNMSNQTTNKHPLGNYPYHEFGNNVKNKSSVVLLTDDGMVHQLKIHDLPETGDESIGVSLKDCFGINGNIIQVIWFDKIKHFVNDNPDLYCIFLTQKGYCKQTKLETIIRSSGSKPVMKLMDDDVIISIIFAPNYEKSNYTVIMYTNKGNGIHIDGSEIREYGLNTKGLQNTILPDNEYFEGMALNCISDNNEYLLFILSSGRCKRTHLKLFSDMKRGSALMNLTPLNNREKIIMIRPCGEHTNDDPISIVYQKSPKIDVINPNDVIVTTRVAKGMKMVTFNKSGDRIVDAY